MRQPDIEIYLLACPTDRLISWLKQNFEVNNSVQTSPSSQTLTLSYQGNDIPVTILEQAAGKKFTSVWFDSEQTPWETDMDCARQAFTELGCEVRCNAQGWQEEGEDDPDQWWRINKNGEGLFIWR